MKQVLFFFAPEDSDRVWMCAERLRRHSIRVLADFSFLRRSAEDDEWRRQTMKDVELIIVFLSKNIRGDEAWLPDLLALGGAEERIRAAWLETRDAASHLAASHALNELRGIDLSEGQESQFEKYVLESFRVENDGSDFDRLLTKSFTPASKRETRARMWDHVEFSVTTPKQLAIGAVSEVNVWLHRATEHEDLLKAAREQHGSEDLAVKRRAGVPVKRNTPLTVELRVPGAEVNPAVDDFFWSGTMGNATFTVSIPSDHACGTIASEAVVRIDGMLLARIAFALQVGGSLLPELAAASARPVRTAFASYANEDRNEVLARIQGMQKMVPGLDVFVDVARLRSGQDWKKELAEQIQQRDVLYLFWSEAASNSRWVDWEWRCALAQKGSSGIDPVPMVPPEKVKPPAELNDMHFNDWVLAYMRGKAKGD